jgi:hypothetical protein
MPELDEIRELEFESSEKEREARLSEPKRDWISHGWLLLNHSFFDSFQIRI